jgi:hypothetical protein
MESMGIRSRIECDSGCSRRVASGIRNGNSRTLRQRSLVACNDDGHHCVPCSDLWISSTAVRIE